LLEWLRGDLNLSARGVTPPSPVVPVQAAPAQVPPVPKLDTTSPPPATLGERPATPTSQEIALRDQRVMLKRGLGTIDFDMAYAHGEQTLLPVVRVEQGGVGASGTVRYGLANDLQLTARVPVAWRRTATFTDSSVSGTNAPNIHHTGFAGDASISLLGVVSRETANRPTLVWNFDSVVPTGPGDAGVGGGLVLSKSYDPAVLFAGASYLYGASIHPADPRSSLARNNLGLQVGYTYAVNDNLALNTVLVGTYRNVRSPDGVSIPPPHEGYTLQLGMTWLLAHNLFIEPGVAISLGGDPGVTFSLNFSSAFSLLKKQ